jgi:tripartite-type tricarboxylate transporter receptor subunit TctC
MRVRDACGCAGSLALVIALGSAELIEESNCDMIVRRDSRGLGFMLRHILYKGSRPALLAIVAGEIDVMVVPTVVAAGQLTGGKLVPLAQSGEVRSSQLPEVPLLRDLKPSIPPLPSWYALVGPAKIDPAIVQKLAGSVNNPSRTPGCRRSCAASSSSRFRARPRASRSAARRRRRSRDRRYAS